MASMRDIKRRRGSVQSTQQITKAMKLVSTVKLQKAKQRAEETTNYFDAMYNTVQNMLAKSGNINHPYLNPSDSNKKLIIMITSNKGLAGGYNSNIVKLITQGGFKKEEVMISAIGKKGKEFMARAEYPIVADHCDMIDAPVYDDARLIAKEALDLFAKGEIGEIYLAYTHFKNTVSHIPTMIKLLPVEADGNREQSEDDKVPMNFEPKEEEALQLIIPTYITSLIYGGMLESVASENGARMQAMDSATSNAEEIIDKLTLQYNRARQGAITQELTEIIAGAQAIS
ncbi:MAG: ATP synthase F1 subunit gamma [Lachnospiraceae bacterium]|nr:ATP synthase F1 subunit gamma [Lachnospiraceae bacterium]